MQIGKLGQPESVSQYPCPSPAPAGLGQGQFWSVASVRSLDWDVLGDVAKGGQLRSFTERLS